MKYKKRLSMVFLFIAALNLTISLFSFGSFAIESEQNVSVANSTFTYLQCDYDTREITDYSVPVANNITQTWELFDKQTIANMQQVSDAFFNNDFSDLSRSIIDDDNELFYSAPISAPYSSVARLVARFDNNGDGIAESTAYGTGFLVSKNVLVTAAHCLIPKDMSSSTLIELQIYFGVHSQGLDGYSYEHPRRWTWSSNWHDETNGWQFDYCVIELHNDISRNFYFNCISSSNASTPQDIYVSGYPAGSHNYQMSCYGELTVTSYYYCHYTNDILSGMSGGPIYNEYCLGIITYHGGTYNQGNLFTPYMYNLICAKISDNQ